MSLFANSNGHLPGVLLPAETDPSQASNITPLMVAAYQGDTGKVKSILKNNTRSVSQHNIHGRTPLDYAIDNCQVRVVDVLMAYGANPDEVDTNGQSVLHRSVEFGSLAKVQACLDIGVNIDLVDRNGDSSLNIAARMDNMAIVEALVKNGCEVSITNKEGMDAKTYAFCSNHKKMLLLLSNSDADDLDDLAKFEMLQRCHDGHLETVKQCILAFGSKIINFKNKQFRNKSPLYAACENDQLVVAKFLKDHGANINVPTDILNTPLIQSAANNKLDIVKWLISEGARINAKNVANQTALHVSVRYGNLQIVKHLVKNGAMLHMRATGSDSAVHIAICKQNIEVLEYLLQQGALPDVIEDDGITPLLHAVQHTDISSIRCLLEHGVDINQCDYSDKTPLLVAVTKNSFEITNYLLQRGADVPTVIAYGLSMSEIARRSGSMEIATLLENVESSTHCRMEISVSHSGVSTEVQGKLFHMFETGSGSMGLLENLLNAGADLNTRDDRGRTPLILAAQKSHKQHVYWLLEKQSSVDPQDEHSHTALFYTVQNDWLDLTEMILKKFHSNNTKDRRGELKSTLSHCIERKSNESLRIVQLLLNDGLCADLRQNCIVEFLENAVALENTAVSQVLLKCLCIDHFPTKAVLNICTSSNPEVVHAFASYIQNAEHVDVDRLATFATRFCLANQREQSVSIIAHRLTLSAEIFLNEDWVSLDHHIFHNTIQWMVKCELDLNIQRCDGNTLLMVAAHKGIPDPVQYLVNNGVNNRTMNISGEDALEIALAGGHYEVAAILSDLNEVEEQESRLVAISPMADASDVSSDHISNILDELHNRIYDTVIMNVIRESPDNIGIMRRGSDNKSIYLHIKGNDFQNNILADIPLKEMVDTRYIYTKEMTQLLTSTALDCANDTNRHVHQPCIISPSDRHLCSSAVVLQGKPTGLTGAVWVLTTADIFCTEMTAGDSLDSFVSKDVQMCVTKGREKSRGESTGTIIGKNTYIIKELNKLKSINIAACEVDKSDMFQFGPRLSYLSQIFHGPDIVLLHRTVYKIGLGTERTDGQIIDVNVSFQDRQGHFYHGAFVVESSNAPLGSSIVDSPSEDQTGAFAAAADGGAAVVDKDSGVVLGLIVASHDDYTAVCPNVSLCLRLDYGVKKLYDQYGLNIGILRMLDKL